MLTKEQYLNQRSELMKAAENLIAEGKTDEANAKMQEIEDLDNKWEDAKKANANLKALKGNEQATNIADQSVDVPGGQRLDNTQTKQPTDEKEVYKNAWAKDMMGMSLSDDERSVFDKTNTEIRNETQTMQEHAVVIPETVRNSIWEEAGELYPILGDARMTFVPGDLTIIKETDSGSDADWYDETTTVSDGDFDLGELNLTGCELAKSIPISWKLRKMSINAFISYITGLLSEKMGAALAKGIVSGKGKPASGDTFKPQPTGIITTLEGASGTPQVITYDPEASTPDPLTYDKLAQAMGLIKSVYKSGASIYAKNTVIWNELAQLKDNDGRPLFVPDVNSGGVGRIFGITVKEEDSVPDNAILFGSVRRGYALNVNENATIYREDHVKARYTDYMSYSIVDGDVLTDKAFALIQRTTTA
ncbi:phage major capsid protein [Tuberibacillus sp. Marseille-P3662]|uniref:phage major capsid protein n=1 Tax=Tuberibacillus sp. Marseille-P3662 TaxID=1965358 RepID=UPI001C3860BA|nr:phage major capsid protein [Tuberibacillus sp. Marseille-P3662]